MSSSKGGSCWEGAGRGRGRRGGLVGGWRGWGGLGGWGGEDWYKTGGVKTNHWWCEDWYKTGGVKTNHWWCEDWYKTGGAGFSSSGSPLTPALCWSAAARALTNHAGGYYLHHGDLHRLRAGHGTAGWWEAECGRATRVARRVRRGGNVAPHSCRTSYAAHN